MLTEQACQNVRVIVPSRAACRAQRRKYAPPCHRALIPPLKGEGGERSEPGGVRATNNGLAARAPTLPSPASRGRDKRGELAHRRPAALGRHPVEQDGGFG